MDLCLVLCLDIWIELSLAWILEILSDPWLDIFDISIGVILGLMLGNSFDFSIVFLIWSSVELTLGTLIVTPMGPLLVNFFCLLRHF